MFVVEVLILWRASSIAFKRTQEMNILNRNMASKTDSMDDSKVDTSEDKKWTVGHYITMRVGKVSFEVYDDEDPDSHKLALSRVEWEDLKQHFKRVEECIFHREENSWILEGNRNILVEVRRHQGENWINLRQYFVRDQYTLFPTKRGVVFSLEDWVIFRQKVGEVDEAFKAKNNYTASFTLLLSMWRKSVCSSHNIISL